MFGGQNMQSMMKQVKKMQEQMQNEQEAIAATDYTGHAPSDVVLATFNGNRELKDCNKSRPTNKSVWRNMPQRECSKRQRTYRERRRVTCNIQNQLLN